MTDTLINIFSCEQCFFGDRWDIATLNVTRLSYSSFWNKTFLVVIREGIKLHGQPIVIHSLIPGTVSTFRLI